MSLDVNVFPGVMAALQTMVGGPTSGQATPTGKLMSVHLGEQWKVSGRGPVAWVMGASMEAPDPIGSDTEKTNWMIEVRFLYQFAADQRHAEDVLSALIEPFREVLRKHTKLSWQISPFTSALPVNWPNPAITRTYVKSSRWLYILVNGIMYRMLTVNVAVGEKVGVTYQAGT